MKRNVFKENKEPNHKVFMNIILEGADCTGKSTLFDELKEKLHLDPDPMGGVFVALKPKSLFHAMIEAGKQLIEFNTTGKGHKLFERSFISELIYGVRFRQYNMQDEKIFVDYLQYLPINTMIIILTAEPKVLMHRYQQRGDSFVKATDILQINKEYLELACFIQSNSNAKVLIVDTNAPIEAIVTHIMNAIDNIQL